MPRRLTRLKLILPIVKILVPVCCRGCHGASLSSLRPRCSSTKTELLLDRFLVDDGHIDSSVIESSALNNNLIGISVRKVTWATGQIRVLSKVSTKLPTRQSQNRNN